MSDLKTNLNAGKEAMNQLKTGSQKVVSAVDGHQLAGAAYTAGKGLFSELIIPTITRTTNALEKVEQELQKYKTADSFVSGEGKLDEDKLTKEIQTLQSMKHSIDSTRDFVQSMSRNHPVADMIDTFLGIQRNLTRQSETMQSNIKDVEKKLRMLREFNGKTSSLFQNSLNELKIAMQGVLVLNNTTVNADGSYSLPEGIDKSWFEKLQAKKETSKLEMMYEEVKEWNKLYKDFVKGTGSKFKSIWYGAAVHRLPDGTLILRRADGLTKRLDEITGLSEFASKNKRITRLAIDGKLSKDGLKILKEAKMYDSGLVTKGIDGRWGESFKATAKTIFPEIGKAIKKPLSFGFSAIVKDAKALKTAKGFGKVIPGINVVSGIFDVGSGVYESKKLAKSDGLKGGEVLASQAGGMAVDVAKVAVTTTVATVAATAGAAAVTAGLATLGVATAPVWATAAGAVALSFAALKGVEWLDKKFDATKNIKKGVNGLIKGVGGWFK
ncbi:hypothetical protein GUJ39_13685 [Enterococcus faecalis]|nr:hypothetical protein [Enterococcus faecalis]